jgi:hypothetical protein
MLDGSALGGTNAMTHACPRCFAANPDVARYCRQCGLLLVAGTSGFLGAGQVAHPAPLEAPVGYERFENARDLFYHWEAAWGGQVLLGTETLGVTLFNAGYPLAEVVLRLEGENDAGGKVFEVRRELASWPRGEPIKLEIASWELPDRARRLRLTLVSAQFGPDT